VAQTITTSSCSVIRLDEYPDLLSIHHQYPERYPFLLESVAHGTRQSRYDILIGFTGTRLELSADGLLYEDGIKIESSGFLEYFDRCWQAERTKKDEADRDFPFRGGWFVYLGYELASEIEPTLRQPMQENDCSQSLPTAVAVRSPAAIIRDHKLQCTYLIVERGQEHLLENMQSDVHGLLHATSKPLNGDIHIQQIIEDEPATYLSQVAQILQYIVDGDVFQVNLSRKWSAHLATDTPAAELYQRLRERNPAPFAGLACLDQGAIISSSPERLVHVCGGAIQTRPIAGTRPRGVGDEHDRNLSDELLAHPKEQAEHIMLIDLERNDLGRVCETGSVEVNELMVLESYAHVHHIVSNIEGRLRDAVTPGEIIAAVFPGGTITGCPKVRCMEIIAELEGEARGGYTGSMGYINRDGDMDLNILIRTLVKTPGRVSLRAGAGIVHDSIAENELNETRAKAKGLLLALQSNQQSDTAS
jgi:anthranilate synthase component 1